MPVVAESSRKPPFPSEMEIQAVDPYLRAVRVPGLPKPIGEI